jgi:carbonic anhydrase
MKNSKLLAGFMISLSFCSSSIYALNTTVDVSPAPADNIAEIRFLMQQMIDVNVRFKDKFHTVLSKESLQQQTPHATIVLCSDSRVDIDVISDTPTGELFVVRNIGNQLPTAYGSVEYGVNHLHTQMLVIVGHSECGAVKTAMQDYSNESLHIKSELDTLHINPKDDLNQNLINNVNNQVQAAIKIFPEKIQSGELVVIGMIYDMHNDFKFGSGQVLLLNINGEVKHDILETSKYIEGIQHLVVLGN